MSESNSGEVSGSRVDSWLLLHPRTRRRARAGTRSRWGLCLAMSTRIGASLLVVMSTKGGSHSFTHSTGTAISSLTTARASWPPTTVATPLPPTRNRHRMSTLRSCANQNSESTRQSCREGGGSPLRYEPPRALRERFGNPGAESVPFSLSLSQAPIASTVYDFLSLLLTPPSSPSCPTPLPPINLVVQLTPLVEGRRAKCHPYFPDREGKTATVSPSAGKGAASPLWIRLEKKEEREGARESVLRVGRQGDQEGRRVVHLEYLGWRDHGTLPLLLSF